MDELANVAWGTIVPTGSNAKQYIEWLIMYTHPHQMLITEIELGGEDQKIDNLLRKLDYTPCRYDHNVGGGGIKIVIHCSYNRDEIKMYDNSESEIKLKTFHDWYSGLKLT